MHDMSRCPQCGSEINRKKISTDFRMSHIAKVFHTFEKSLQKETPKQASNKATPKVVASFKPPTRSEQSSQSIESVRLTKKTKRSAEEAESIPICFKDDSEDSDSSSSGESEEEIQAVKMQAPLNRPVKELNEAVKTQETVKEAFEKHKPIEESFRVQNVLNPKPKEVTTGLTKMFFGFSDEEKPQKAEINRGFNEIRKKPAHKTQLFVPQKKRTNPDSSTSSDSFDIKSGPVTFVPTPKRMNSKKNVFKKAPKSFRPTSSMQNFNEPELEIIQPKRREEEFRGLRNFNGEEAMEVFRAKKGEKLDKKGRKSQKVAEVIMLDQQTPQRGKSRMKEKIREVFESESSQESFREEIRSRREEEIWRHQKEEKRRRKREEEKRRSREDEIFISRRQMIMRDPDFPQKDKTQKICIATSGVDDFLAVFPFFSFH